MRAALLVVALGSCAFAQKHPAVTAGIATGMIALVPCLPAVDTPTTCLLVGAGAGVAIGGITGLVTLFADTTAHELHEENEPPIVRIKTRAEPPPSPPPAPIEPTMPMTPDAGVPTADAGLVDAP